jgi:ribonuclease-3
MNDLIEAAVSRLEAALGHRFRDRSLAIAALTHASWLNEHPDAPEHNERLEFLGDAVLQLVASLRLFRGSDGDQGDLTLRRQRLVSGRNVLEIGRAIGIEPLVRRSRGLEPRGVDRLVEDATEAVFGAVFLDGGLEAATAVISPLLIEGPGPIAAAPTPSPKTALNEVCEKRWKKAPVYRASGSEGPPHLAEHSWELVLPDGRVFEAKGRNKREIHHDLALAALEALAPDPT